jgi:hypothetical protein
MPSNELWSRITLLFLLGGVAALGYALYCRAQATRHARSDVARRRAASLDPLLLTERGRAYRTRYHLALLLGFLAILIGLLAGVVAFAGVLMI